jgi:hypothetical protein
VNIRGYKGQQFIWVSNNTPVNLPAIKRLLTALWNLSNDSARSASNHAEARYDHIRWNNCAIQYPHEILDDCKLPNDASLADMNMASNKSGFDNRCRSDVNMVTDFQRIVGEDPVGISNCPSLLREHSPFVKLRRWPQTTPLAKKAIPPNRNRDITLSRSISCTRKCAEKIPSYDDFSLDYRLASEDDIRCADDLGFSGDLVTGVLCC